MALDPRFVLQNDLQVLFRDKATGLPLRSGFINFYEDKARNIPKLVYQLSGTPPNYTYVPIGTSIQLNSAGYVGLDNTNPINQFYYFIVDGTPDTTTNTLDLYYIEITDSGGVLQDTREAWPNAFLSSSDSEVSENFVSNGQLLLHTDLPETETFSAGEIREAVTNVAYGGYEYLSGTPATKEIFVTFERFGSFVNDPAQSPRYAIKIEKRGVSNETRAELRIKFGDVNKFASLTQEYTFQFSARSDIGSIIESINLVKNFGTGGSPSPEQVISLATNVSVTNTFTDIVASGFVFGENTTETIGTNDDDYVALSLRFPLTQLFSYEFTNFLLAEGDLTDAQYPVQTDRQFIESGLGGGFPVPNPDGSDLFLPVLLNRQGWQFDRARLGTIAPISRTTLLPGELLCDGSKFRPSEKSSDGIPYQRLFNVIGTQFGSGIDYINLSAANESSGIFPLANREAGVVTAPANGAVSPAFTFFQTHVGTASYEVRTWFLPDISTNTPEGVVVFLENSVDFPNPPGTNALAPPIDGTAPNDTGFTFTVPGQYDVFNDNALFPDASVGVTSGRGLFTITDLPATVTGLEGKYFEFDSMQADNTTVNKYYVWFQVNSVGTDPAIVGKTGIKIDLPTGSTGGDLARALAWSLRAGEFTVITTTDQNTWPAGTSYWEFDTPAENFYVWYNVASAGTDPMIAGRTGIEVAIDTTDSAATVATKTVTTLSTFYFQVPDLRGQALRGFDPNASEDLDANSRFIPSSGEVSNSIGSQQLYSVQNHTHIAGDLAQFSAGTIDGYTNAAGTDYVPNYVGGQETRPLNMAFNFIMYY